jgi:hypothetical protein
MKLPTSIATISSFATTKGVETLKNRREILV